MRSLMDTVIEKKLEEMAEADIGSSKDILEILALSHKMSIEILDRQIKYELAKASNIKNQTNVQINNPSSNYEALLEKLWKNNGTV
jgi:hypothetical protein